MESLKVPLPSPSFLFFKSETDGYSKALPQTEYLSSLRGSKYAVGWHS